MDDLKSSLIEMYREHLKTCTTARACFALDDELGDLSDDLLDLQVDVREKGNELVAREGQHE